MKKILTQEEIEKMKNYAEDLFNTDKQVIDIVCDFWYSGTTATLTETGKANIRKLLKRYKFEEVLRAMKMSMSYIVYNTDDNPEFESIEKAYNKITTICNANRSDIKYEGDLKLVYIKGIIKKRLEIDDYSSDAEIITLLRNTESKEVSREELRDISKTITSWTDLLNKLDKAVANKQQN